MKVGLIAGYGKLSLITAKILSEKGYDVVIIALSESVSENLSPYNSKIYTVSVTQIRKILKILKDEGIKNVLFAGKITKELIYSNLKFDMLAVKTLLNLKDRKDDTIMLAVVELLKNEGIEVLKQTDILKGLLAEKGVFSKKKPDKKQSEDIQFGLISAIELGRLDIGQTVVVKNKAVMAVEAIEGTDAAIERGCRLARGKAVVVKTAKPRQDERFDVPTVGVDTLKKIADNNGSVLAVEAGETFVVGFEECVKFADQHGLIFLSAEGVNNDA